LLVVLLERRERFKKRPPSVPPMSPQTPLTVFLEPYPTNGRTSRSPQQVSDSFFSLLRLERLDIFPVPGNPGLCGPKWVRLSLSCVWSCSFFFFFRPLRCSPVLVAQIWRGPLQEPVLLLAFFGSLSIFPHLRTLISPWFNALSTLTPFNIGTGSRSTPAVFFPSGPFEKL